MELWIAFELVSSSYWKQLTTAQEQRRTGCELLSNLYLRHIENNLGTLHTTTSLVVNCFRTCIFVILKTTNSQPKVSRRRCELLSNLYLRHIENNTEKLTELNEIVVNCFRTCIFVILKTTVPGNEIYITLLWIAFELVSSSYWKQRTQSVGAMHRRCELLSNLYLRHIENNCRPQLSKTGVVVNCFRTCIFVILKTTPREKMVYYRKLWIAFELVSSSYWKQPFREVKKEELCCELLSNLYLRHIENNTDEAIINTNSVVNCFRTCIFVILKTTRTLRHSCQLLLWIAFELVSSSYWKQQISWIISTLSGCELLSNLYLRHIENNAGWPQKPPPDVVNCFRTCIFVILKTT